MIDCIEWTGCRDKFGYGMRRVNGKVRRLHLIAYEEANGPIPNGLVVRHKCDNPSCYNPDHLELGTRADNVKDRDVRGRTAKGVKVGCAKLTPEIVAEAKRLYASGGLTHRSLGEKYGVGHRTIARAIGGATWI